MAIKDLTGPYHCLLIKIPKCATASLNQIVKQFGGHRTALEWRKCFSQATWDSLYKFSIVRNPYDRFQSGYYHSKLQAVDINEWLIEKGVEGARTINEQVFKPQVDYLCGGDGNPLVDFWGQFEHLVACWRKISKEIGVSAELPHEHETNEVRVELNEKSKQIIAEYYADDFETFSYEK